jgi:predicted GIY-YIG superfamily endonuclease
LSSVALIFSREYTNIEDATNIESWLKKQKNKKLIEKFMTENWEDPK